MGECARHEVDPSETAVFDHTSAVELVAGVRFRDSGRTYFFRSGEYPTEVGDWVVVETSRGREAGRVVIAPHQILLNRLQRELKPVVRRLDQKDVERMHALTKEAATAVKTFGAFIRARRLSWKPISTEYSFGGSSLTLNYSAPERDRISDHLLRDLTCELTDVFSCRVVLRQVGPGDEARLLGGLGRCGRTLCCSSWLPVDSGISTKVAKTQDLPLNLSEVPCACGCLLCCLSYENEQYKQMKAVMPRLGQTIETPIGPGIVVSVQALKELVTVRLTADNTDAVFSSADLGLGGRPAPGSAPNVALTRKSDRGMSARADGSEPVAGEAPSSDAGSVQSAGRRRRPRSRPDA